MPRHTGIALYASSDPASLHRLGLSSRLQWIAAGKRRHSDSFLGPVADLHDPTVTQTQPATADTTGQDTTSNSGHNGTRQPATADTTGQDNQLQRTQRDKTQPATADTTGQDTTSNSGHNGTRVKAVTCQTGRLPR